MYRPDRLQYSALGDSIPAPRPLVLSGLQHLSSLESSDALSTLQEIISIQAQLQDCEQDYTRLIGLLMENVSSSSVSSLTQTPVLPQSALPPVQEITLSVLRHSQSSAAGGSNQDEQIQNNNEYLPTLEEQEIDTLSNMTPIVEETSAATASSVGDSMSDQISERTPTSTTTSMSTETVRTIVPSQISQSCTIHNVEDHMNNSNYLDNFRAKHDGDYRLILQNPRGIKEFRDNDPEYFPTMNTLREGQSDLMCFVETNMPWHKNDFLYDISVANKAIWNTPTKSISASCRMDKKGSKNYQPGGVLNVVANSLTTKIQSTSSDSLGRWTKIRFFAKNSALVVYSVYRPNPSTLSTTGINSSWMQ